MLYWLLGEKLFHYFSPLRLFQYVTSRTAFAGLTALFLSLFMGPWMIRKLREFQIGQHIREDGPKSHQKKAGTPTMGGLLIVICIVVPTLLFTNLRNPYVWVALLGLISNGAIGFYDDFTKVKKMRNLGLTPRQKFGLQILAAMLVGVVLLVLQTRGLYSTEMNVPFTKDFRPNLLIDTFLKNPVTYPLAFLFFFLFMILVIAGSSDAVNLTDGLEAWRSA
jgi:phospho-N-acetylmuramoyl-pentapeptide-transferase